MTAMTDFDRLVTSWLETAGPTRPDDAVVESALTAARRRRRRRGAAAWLTGPAPWPATRTVGPIDGQLVRILIVALIAIALVAASFVVGSRLLRNSPLPFTSDRARFVSLGVVPNRMDVTSVDLLADGRVLLTGPRWDLVSPSGENWTGWTLTIWNPATKEFGTFPRALRPPQPPDTVPSSKPVDRVIPLEDGRVLVIDGWEGPLGPTASIELFEPRTGTYAAGGSLTAPRLSMASIRLADGRVLFSGGEPPEKDHLPPNTVDGEPALATAELFDPDSTSSSPTGSMGSARLGHAMKELADGRILVLGGSDGSEVTSHLLRSAEIYDPTSGAFSPTGSMARARGYFKVPPVGLADGRVLIIGGSGGDGASTFDSSSEMLRTGPVTTEIYDPIIGTFVAGPPLPHEPSTATVLEDGVVLLTGTWSESHQKARMVPSSQRDEHHYAWTGLFDPTTGATREIAPPEGATVSSIAPSPHAIALPGGRLLYIEGWDVNDSASPEGTMAMFTVQPSS
jgi:hypothetical protein